MSNLLFTDFVVVVRPEAKDNSDNAVKETAISLKRDNARLL